MKSALLAIAIVFSAFYVANSQQSDVGNTQDYITKNIQKITASANFGDAESQLYLGVACFKGWGVPKDYAVSYSWFNLSCAQGNEQARWCLKEMESRMTPDQVSEGQKISRTFKPEKITIGDVNAMDYPETQEQILNRIATLEHELAMATADSQWANVFSNTPNIEAMRMNKNTMDIQKNLAAAKKKLAEVQKENAPVAPSSTTVYAHVFIDRD